MKRPINLLLLFVFLAAAVLLTAPVQANALSLVNSRAGIFENDFIDWGAFGPAFTGVTSGSVISSNSGLVQAMVSNPADDFEIRQQSFGGWNGNFAPGDNLLWTNDSEGPMIIRFDAGMFAVGAQIQQDDFGMFTGVIEAYDGLGVLLGSFSVAGSSTSSADNSAIFLGVLSDQPNILEIRYYMDGLDEDFAINALSMRYVCLPVPVPPAVWLLGSGLLGLLGLRRKFIF